MTPDQLQIPDPSTPRPGDTVVWFQSRSPLSGTLRGHTGDGRPLAITDDGAPSHLRSFDSVRLYDPNERLGPNWSRLDSDALILQAAKEEKQAFDDLLEQRIPPGPRYRELVEEIWMRGYETFVVGGTVRDVLGQVDTRDVDLVTTMPLTRAHAIVRDMYGAPPTLEDGAIRNGHLRLGGGTPTNTSSYIDFCVFKDRHVGTTDALFGDSFTADTENRDFACNAVYYDPIHAVLIDPTGHGIRDAEERRLRVVCSTERRNPRQLGQIGIRYMKFRLRGFDACDGCAERISSDCLPGLGAMDELKRVAYLNLQLFKREDPDKKLDIFRAVEAEFSALEAKTIWDRLVHPHRDELL